MKLRVGYLKERKFVLDVEDWTVQTLEDHVRNMFSLESSVLINIYFGDRQINENKSTMISELGVVSGDLLIVKMESSEVLPSADEKMEISTEPSTSSNLGNELIELDKFADLLAMNMMDIKFEKSSDYRLDDPFVQVEISYFKSPASQVQIRCASSRFFVNGIQSIHLDVTLIGRKDMIQLDRFVLNPAMKRKDFEEFICKDVKVEIFGSDNNFIQTMFCNDVNLTLKLFEYCGMESVIKLRKVCKTAYKKSNSRFLDQRYYKQRCVEEFNEEEFKSINMNDPTPYRKALFKKMRNQDRAAYISYSLSSSQSRYSAENDDFLMLSYQRQTHFTDYQHIFDDNFYGQETYRPHYPNYRDPGAPNIRPRIRDEQNHFPNHNRFI